MSTRLYIRLRTDPDPFQAILDGRKRFEVRFEDRGSFEVGDQIELREFLGYRDDEPHYSGRRQRVCVTYILRGPKYGLPINIAILSIEKVSEDGA